MGRLIVQPIVTGHGEDSCIRILLQRIWHELLHGEFIDVLKPIRHKQGALETKDGVQKAVRLAHDRISDHVDEFSPKDPLLILIMLDLERGVKQRERERFIENWEEELRGWAIEVDDRIDVLCVVIVVEYETWFVAAAEPESLGEYLNLGDGSDIPDDPEHQHCGSDWVEKRFKSDKHRKKKGYSKTVDQARMTRAMDLNLCRQRSPSFRRLCEGLQQRVR